MAWYEVRERTRTLVAGGSLFETLSSTGADVVAFVASSTARAVSSCVPLSTLCERHCTSKGSVVSVPTFSPSTRKVTASTRRSSHAVAPRVTSPLTSPCSSGPGFETTTVGSTASLPSVYVIASLGRSDGATE